MTQSFIEDYFNITTTPYLSPLSQWEVHKVMVYGDFIKYSSALKKEGVKRLRDLEETFCKTSQVFKQLPNSQTQSTLDQIRTELDILLSELAAKQIKYTHHLLL